MKCSDILQQIEQNFPVCKAYEWDNVGLLVGKDDKEVYKIFVALDATDEIICEAKKWGADMLLTHHPLIFTPIKKVNNQNFITNRIINLIQADIAYYAMHTNYDIVKMADLASSQLKMIDVEPLEVSAWDVHEGLGKIGYLEEHKEVTLETYAQYVKDIFSLNGVKIYGDMDMPIRKVAILPGSGKSAIDSAIALGANVLITGDIGHHEGIDAHSRGLAIIDAGHYGIEHIFIQDMCNYLTKQWGEELEIKGATIIHPFQII